MDGKVNSASDFNENSFEKRKEMSKKTIYRAHRIKDS
jgi:hypothetical protein